MNPMDLINSLLAPQQMGQTQKPSPMMMGGGDSMTAGSEMNGPKPQGQGGLLESVMKIVGGLAL